MYNNYSDNTVNVWGPEIWHVLLNISGLGAFFSNDFAFKLQAQASRFEYHKPPKRNKIFQLSFRLLPQLANQFSHMKLQLEAANSTTGFEKFTLLVLFGVPIIEQKIECRISTQSDFDG